MTQQTVAGTFGSTGQSATFIPMPSSPFAHERGTGYFNFTLWGTFSATVQLERSFNAGTTWHAVSKDAAGLAASYTAPMSVVALEPEHGVVYRLNCTAWASGTVNYRLSR